MCDAPYTPIDQQEITSKATFWDRYTTIYLEAFPASLIFNVFHVFSS